MRDAGRGGGSAGGAGSSAGTGATGAAVDDELWAVIGDPTRRRILDLLVAEGRGTATSLSERLPVTRQAVAKHLGVLDRVGLVNGVPSGRERHYEIDQAQFARAVAQLNAVGMAWDGRLARIKRLAEAIRHASEDGAEGAPAAKERGDA